MMIMKRIVSILVVMLLISACAFAETASLKVQGSGVVNVTADVARVVLGVRESVSDVKLAQSTVNEKINAIFDALLEAGVSSKDIATESIYIFANYDYSGEEERLVGYTASNSISIVTADIDKMGEYIDIAFEAGANSLDSVEFSAQDDTQAQKEALKLAVENAYEKAEVIAEAAGMEIIAVKSFDEAERQSYAAAGAKYSNARVEAAAVDSSTRVQASSLQVQASVLVEFELGEVGDAGVELQDTTPVQVPMEGEFTSVIIDENKDEDVQLKE